MFRHVVGFELKYQLRSPLFWGTAVIFFLGAFASIASDDIRLGWGGQVFRNAPYAVVFGSMLWSIFAMFIATAFASSVVLRDDETGFGPIIQATRLSRFDYLFGRFTGGFIAAALAFFSVVLGMLAAVVVPGPAAETIGPIRIGDYLYAYTLFCVPTVFVLSAGFFALATTLRSQVASYVGTLVVLAIYLFTSVYLIRDEFGPLATLADPFGIASITRLAEFWTANDRNTMLPPFTGIILLNRLVWCGVGLAFLGIAWGAFTRKGFVSRADRRPARGERVAPPAVVPTTPPPPTERGLGWGPLAALTRFELMGVLRSPLFIVILGFAFMSAVSALWFAGDDNTSVIYPVTRVMIQTLAGDSTIPLFVAAFFAGELVWRDRERRMHEIVDATPSPDWAFLLPKILAICTVLLAMGVMNVVAAVSVQLLKGFTAIEYGHYLTWYLAPWFLTMVMYAVLAVLVQTLSPHKFVGLLVILLYFVLESNLPKMGLEGHLYIYATTPPTPLSDMNGVGRYAGYAGWYRAYWAAGAVILTVLTWALWRRGASAPLAARLRALPRRLAGTPGVIGGVAALVMASLGGWIYYNNYVLNDFPTLKESQRLAAAYEKELLPLEHDPQPHIVDVKMKVDLYPDRPKVTVNGSYVIENKTSAPIGKLYVGWMKAQLNRDFVGTMIYPELNMTALDVPGAKLTRDMPRFNFRIYTFDTPMQPGERRTIRFSAYREQKGFRNGGNEDRVVANGTFVDNFSIAPWLGVLRHFLLKDRATRRGYGLVPDLRPIPLGNEKGRRFQYFRHDSDYVTLDVTVTGPADQTLLAPGNKVSDQVVDGRRVARFRTEAPTLYFFSVQAARYAVRKAVYDGTTMEVYYNPNHAYNVARMINVLRDGLRYYNKTFSPYQYKQVRIVEFPAYNNFAQAFPGTIPYSEAAGFITKVNDRTGVDDISYATAHELGHQWWGHQIVGADMQGSTVLSETLAEYSAMMVTEKRYGEAMMRRFNVREIDSYLNARGSENVAEPTLEQVEDQAYVRYNKGGAVMYLLRDVMGEQAVSRALHGLLGQFAFKGPPYPTSRHLIAALRAEAKPEQQQLITDLFQRITLYDYKVVDARSSRRADGKWVVAVTVEAHKRYADGKGRETEAPLDEAVDVGAFASDPGKPGFKPADVVSIGKQRIRTGRQRLTMVLDRRPTFVGLDPYVRYIDRNKDDNVMPVAAR